MNNNNNKHYIKVSKNITYISDIAALLVWIIILFYIFSTQINFSNLMIYQKALLVLPFLFAIVNFIVYMDDDTPITPEWKFCFNKDNITKKEKKNNIVAEWNWQCGQKQQRFNFGTMKEVRNKNVWANSALLLLGILCSVLPKKMNIFDNKITRTFSLINVALTLLVLALSRTDMYGLYTSYFILPFINIISIMNLSSLLIVIVGFMNLLDK